MGDNLFRNLREGKQSLGVSLSIPSPEIVEILGQAGFDMVYFSMHASRMGWDDIAHMVRATYRWGITPCARIAIQPWVGDHNPGLSVDAHHAFALGANVVIASVHDAREARELVETLREESHITGDLRDHNLPTQQALEEWTKQSQEGLMAVPMVESTSSWADLEGICSVEGLRAVFLGVGDLTRILGVDRQLEHPIDEGCDKAIHRHGKVEEPCHNDKCWLPPAGGVSMGYNAGQGPEACRDGC